jgi:hypothetical protein
VQQQWQNLRYNLPNGKMHNGPKEKGLFSQLVNSQEILEAETVAFAEKLANYNPEALTQMKKIFWQNTENWNELLYERAAISGKTSAVKFHKKWRSINLKNNTNEFVYLFFFKQILMIK